MLCDFDLFLDYVLYTMLLFPEVICTFHLKYKFILKFLEICDF